MKKRILTTLLAGSLLLAALSGCGSKHAAGTDRRAANELVVGIAQDLDESLDPHKMVAAGTKEVLFNVFEGLVKPTPDGDLVCAVAEDYTVSEDRTVYTFTLRPNVKFHNGDAVTAEDVVWSLRRCADTSESETPLVPAFSAVKSIDKVDDRTVSVTIDAPSNEFISYLTCAIIPEGYAGQDTAPVGTGPFKFVSRAAQDNIVLEKFDGYWGTPAGMDQVTYKIIENADSLVMSLQSGAIDLCAHLTSAQTGQLSKDEFDVAEGTMNLVQALYLNNTAAPLDDIKVRQALSCAVDKDAVIDLACDGYGAPIGSSMYPAFGKYFDDALTYYYPHDVEKAKALLAEAGYPDGFEMTITVPSNYQPHVDTAQVVAEQLKAVNVNAKIQLVEWGTWVSDVYQGRNFQSTICGFDASTMTARALLERFTTGHGKNFINYSSANYDALFAQAQETYDDAEQTELYKAMERDLTENAANVYIQDLADLVAVRKGLTGLEFYPIYVLDVSTLRWEA